MSLSVQQNQSILVSLPVVQRKSNSLAYKIKNKSYKNNQKKLYQTQDIIPPNLLGTKNNKNFVIRKVQTNIDVKEKAAVKQIDYNDPNSKYYYLGKGNNHELVKRILDRRKIWIQNNELSLVHFKWVQNSTGVKFSNLNKITLCFNHFQFHKQITNKQYLIKNMVNFCQANKINAFDYTPTTFIIDLNDQNLSLNLNAFIKFFNHNSPLRKQAANLNLSQIKQNLHLPRLRQHHSTKNQKRCQGNFYCRPSVTPTFFSSQTNYMWLLKPTFLNRGRGIHIFTDLNQLQKLINEYSEGHQQKIYSLKQKQIQKQDEKQKQTMVVSTIQLQNKSINTQIKTQSITNQSQQNNKQGFINQNNIKSTLKIQTNIQSQEKDHSPEKVEKIQDKKTYKIKSCSFVVQKYIERPLLINGRKFDIRVWVLVTQNLQVYFFKQGYIRTSCEQYNPKDVNNMYIHLTNNAIQKYSDKYEKYEFGNQLSFGQFQKILEAQGYFKFKQKILKKIKQSIWTSMCAVRRKLNQNERKYCFQIFGYDFLIDQKMKTWLIQVNTNPCIQQSSPLLAQLIPRMLDDAFKLTIDKMFPPSQQIIGPHVDNYEDNQNMFQLLGDFFEANNNTLKKRFTFARR